MNSIRSVCCCLSALFLAAPAIAQSVKLNRPLATGVTGAVELPRVSADGTRVVFLADDDGDGTGALYSTASDGTLATVRLANGLATGSFLELGEADRAVYVTEDLYSVPIDGSSSPMALNAPLPDDSFVLWPRISPLGARAVYFVGHGFSQPNSRRYFLRLHSAPVSAGAPAVELSGSIDPEVGLLPWFDVSPDGTQVVFATDRHYEEPQRVFVVPTDGSGPARELPVPATSVVGFLCFLFDGDGSHVFYVADQEEAMHFELFTVATDGSQPPRKLSGPLAPSGNVGRIWVGSWPDGYWFFTPTSLLLTGDGSRIVYEADAETDERFELYSVPVDGSAPAVRISSASDRDLFLAGQSGSAARVIYTAEEDTDTQGLFSVPIDGSRAPVRLSGPMAAGGGVVAAVVSEDGQRVVYSADQDVAGRYELFSAPIDGGAPAIRLNSAFAPGGSLFEEYGFALLDELVVYQADQEVDGLFGLFAVPIEGGPVRGLAPGPVADFTAGDKHAFFRDERHELFSVSTAGDSRPVRLHELPTSTVGDVEGFDLSPDGSRVAYRAAQEPAEAVELYSTDSSGKGGPVQLHPDLLPGRRVSHQRFTPDGSRLVFVADLETPGAFELFSVRPDGMEQPVRLGALKPLGLTEAPFLIGPDGVHVLFPGASTERPLFSVRVDGTTPPVRLGSTQLPIERGVRISQDGLLVAFLDQGQDHAQLFTVPTDGSTPAVRVSLESQRVQEDFVLTPDGRFALFVVRPGRSRLWVAPADGSSVPLPLSPGLQADGSITAFAVDAASTRAVYLADQERDEVFELYSVPLDASAPAVKLSAPLAAEGDVIAFQVSPRGERVVYRSDPFVDERLELFSVPLDGSRPPVKLNGPLSAGGDVRSFQISPDGARTLYLADEDTDEVVALHSVPTGGTLHAGGRVRLSPLLTPGGDVRSFRMSADSRTVAFAAARDAAGAFTLLSVPIEGSKPAAELAGPFAEGGSVLDDYRIGADASVVIYRSDQVEPGVIELYSARPPASRSFRVHGSGGCGRPRLGGVRCTLSNAFDLCSRHLEKTQTFYERRTKKRPRSRQSFRLLWRTSSSVAELAPDEVERRRRRARPRGAPSSACARQ